MANYTVNPEANKIIKEYAERVGVDPETALNNLIITADSRKKALKKYAESHPRPKAEKKAKAPKAAKKAPKGTSLAKKKAAPKAKAPKKAKHVRAIDVVSGDVQDMA